MKQLIKAAALAMSLLLTVSVNHTNAAPVENANGLIMNSFHQDFQGAELISTNVSKTFSKLTFKLDGNIMFAFYTDNGELLAVSRNIVSTKLPLALLSSLKKYQAKSWITELFEIKSDNQDIYYATIENADTRIVLRSNGSEWETYTSTKK